MAVPSLDRLLARSVQEHLIDAHAVDQDGSYVIIIGEVVHYFSDKEAEDFLNDLLEKKGPFSRGEGEDAASA